MIFEKKFKINKLYHMFNEDNYFVKKIINEIMRFTILKVDCNHDIWVLKGGNI